MTRKALGVLAAAVAVTSSGCTSWRLQSTPTAKLLADKPLQTIRVVTVDSIPVTLHQARIVGDSVTGHPTPNAIERRTINLRDIATVSTKGTNIGKTLIAGLAIVGGLLAYSFLQGLNGTQP